MYHGRKVLQLQSTVLCEMLNITTDIESRSHKPLPRHCGALVKAQIT